MKPPRSRFFRPARWLIPALLLLAAGVYLGRDLPRRLVERQLAAALGGPVKLEHLDRPKDGLFVLRGLEIESSELSPALRHARIERIEARAAWRQILRGEVEHLSLHGLSAAVDPSRPLMAPAKEGEAAAELPFATLEIHSGATATMVDAEGRELAAADLAAKVANQPGLPASFAATLRGFDLADLEVLLPLELPEAARRQLAGLALGAIEAAGSSSPAGIELSARNPAWQEAFFALRGEQVEARLRGLELAALSSPGAPLVASGRVDLAASGTLQKGHLELTLGPAELSFEGQSAELGGLRLAADFEQAESGLQLAVSQLAATLLAAELLPPEARRLLPLELAWQGRLDLGQRAAAGTGELRSQKLGAFPFDGRLSADAGLDLRVATPELPVATLLALLPAPPEQVGKAGFLSAKIVLEGQPAAVDALADLRFRGLEPTPQVAGLEGQARLRWSAARPLAVGIESLAAKGRAILPIEGLAPVPVEAGLRGAADLERRHFELRDFSLATEKLGRVAGEATLDLPADYGLAGAAAQGAFELSGLSAARTLAALGPAGPGGAAGAGALSFSGDFAASPKLSKAPGGPWLAAGKWSLSGAGFASAAGDRVLEGLAASGDFSAQAEPALADGAAYSLRAGGESGGFQLLWGTLFGDFSAAKIALEASAAGRLGSPPKLALKVLPGGGVTVEAGLAAAPSGALGRYSFSLLASDLEAARREWLAPLFAAAAPLRFAGRLELSAEGDLPAGPGGAFSARGRLELHGGGLANGLADGAMAAEGVELALPFDLRGRDGVYTGPVLGGSLAARRVAFGAFELPPLASRLRVVADSLTVEEALEAPFAGGRVRLERIAAGAILAASPRLETAISFQDVSLAELFAGAGLPPIDGQASGSLPRVVVQGQKLEVEGGGKVALFGGEIEIGGISGSDVLSAYPRIALSARFRQIDLGQITRRFDFGEMHGILEGEVENLVLFRNVPLAFSARVVSVERQGVKQTIDVKAVQNLTILGTGASTNILDKGIQRFFKRYNYAALGISAQLGNDVLLLRGLEHRGGQELFLRGRSPFSIDVVNAQPGKTVGFQAMVRRLKSLNLSSARTE